MKKQETRKKILQALLENANMTRQDIAAELRISMPTALTNCNELLEQQVLVEVGELESTGGRKAKSLGVNGNFAYSLGMEIALKYVYFVLMDFSAAVVAEKKVNLVFADEPSWYQKLNEDVMLFLKEQKVAKEKVFGAGLSFPGIIDEEKNVIVRSHILQVENIDLDRFRKAIPFRLHVNNDANCAGFAEIKMHRSTYLYLSLNESVGGVFIQEGNIQYGDTLQAGEIGHMILFPGGETCYCGKKGCADSYLSPKRLCKDGKSLDAFFKAVESGKKKSLALWEEYLENLSIFVTNLRMILNVDIIIGGEIGRWIPTYMDRLCEKAQKYDLFSRDINYLFTCTTKGEACAVGAALKASELFCGEIL